MGYSDRNQSIKKKENIKKVVEYFDQHGGTIKEISEALDMTKSSVQRYLNDNTISEITSMETANKIKEYLLHMKKYGNKMGGLKSQENNIYIKDELGKFKGSSMK